jgi:hypothetical protein
MSIVQGSALPNVTETTTTKDTAPAGYTGYLENIAKAGSSALTKPGALDSAGKETTVLKTGADLVAGYDPMQNLGYNQLQSAVGAYQPGLTAAGQTAGRAAQGITPERIQALLNPYTTNVVNEMARLTNQNMERNLLPGLKAGFVGTGGLGSQRYAGALGQSLADMQANLTGQQTGALSAGYGQALKGALDEAQLMNLAAKTQADIAKQEQDLGIAGAGALTKAGAERQKYEQSLLDAPLAIAKEASGLMRGLALPLDQTKTATGPKSKDYYQSSDAQRLGGLATFLGSAAGGKGIDVFKNNMTGLFDYLSGKRDIIDLGGGVQMKFDTKTGSPYIQGGSDYLAVDDPMQQIYKDAGYISDETGILYNPNLQYDEYNFNYAG